MSYLQLASGIPDFTKAVLSMWFRVPQAAIGAAALQLDNILNDSTNFDVNLSGIVPLVTFGPTQETVNFYAPIGFGQKGYEQIGSSTQSPGFIGINCGRPLLFNDPSHPAILQARIQYSSGAPDAPLPDAPLGPTQALNVGPDYFLVGDMMGDSTGLAGGSELLFIDVAPGQWHHVLVSFDMSGGASTSDGPAFASGCQFWWAFDDVSYNGTWLGPFGAQLFPGGDGDLNRIVSNFCVQLAPHSFDAGPISASGNPLGIPASAANVDHVRHVEMAELQFFTGITLDTSVEANRRAFIDKDGKPVSPTKKASKTDPQSGSIELLGKKPEVLLHKSGNWKKGHNTGSLGVDSKGKDIPSGQFSPAGKIEAYKPEPSLHGPQTPPAGKAAPVRLSRAASPRSVRKPPIIIDPRQWRPGR